MAELRESTVCVHYNGMSHKCCEKNIDYDDTFGREPGLFYRLPCIPDGAKREGVSRETCAYYEALGQEEHAERNRLAMEAMGRAVLVSDAILKECGEEVEVAGVMDCPCCEGTVMWSRSSNGHVHALCNTPDCVRFMQ